MPEKIERIKYIPIHQHINCDQVEISFMISSMLIEMPIIQSKKSNSKFFKKLLDNYEKNHFYTRESFKDVVYFASQELEKGDWKSCYEILYNNDVTKHIGKNETMLDILKNKIKESSLRCYLLNFHHSFSNISLDELKNQFDLDKKRIRIIVCQLLQSELKGYFDDQDNIYLDSQQNSKLQNLAQDL